MPEPQLDRWHFDLMYGLGGATVAAVLALVFPAPLIDPLRQLAASAYLAIAVGCVLVWAAGHMQGFPLRRPVQFLAGFGLTMSLVGGFITSMP